MTKTEIAKSLLLGYKLGDIPGNGHQFTMERFLDLIKYYHHSKNDYHYFDKGHGFYGYDDKICTIPITIEMIDNGLINMNFTHIIWFWF